jgi:hypothetical protein
MSRKHDVMSNMPGTTNTGGVSDNSIYRIMYEHELRGK